MKKGFGLLEFRVDKLSPKRMVMNKVARIGAGEIAWLGFRV